MHTAPRHVANAEQGLPKRLALNGEVPCPGFRILEILTLTGHHQDIVTADAGTESVDSTVGHAGVRLERRIPAQKYRVTYAQTCNETPCASAEHRLGVDRALDKTGRGIDGDRFARIV